MLVHHRQRLHQRAQLFHHPFGGKPAPLLFQVGLQRFPLYELHHDICRAVFLKVVPHRHDARQCMKPRQPLRLIDELLPPRPEEGLRISCIGAHQRRGVPVPRHKTIREILLDRQLHLEVQIPPEVEDAKAPLPDGAPQQVFPV